MSVHPAFWLIPGDDIARMKMAQGWELATCHLRSTWGGSDKMEDRTRMRQERDRHLWHYRKGRTRMRAVTVTLFLNTGHPARKPLVGRQAQSPWVVSNLVGSAVALLLGKLLRVRKVFAPNILLSIKSGTCLENHWSFWKVSGLSRKFPDCPECFWIVWKVSVFFLEIIEGLESFQIVWQVTKLSEKFPEYLDDF